MDRSWQWAQWTKCHVSISKSRCVKCCSEHISNAFSFLNHTSRCQIKQWYAILKLINKTQLPLQALGDDYYLNVWIQTQYLIEITQQYVISNYVLFTSPVVQVKAWQGAIWNLARFHLGLENFKAKFWSPHRPLSSETRSYILYHMCQ